MKVIQLTAENVKRLRAVEISPDGNLQVITGRNGQGKTSVLDAIWLALGGGTAAKGTQKPIRDGEARASVTLDLGDLIVARTWSGDKTTLKVTSPDGANYQSPQRMLDALIGRLSFDPLAFTQMSAREQTAALLDLVDLDVDLDQLNAERARLYEQRTDVGRQGKAIGDVSVDDTLPSAEQSAGDLIAKIREAHEVNRDTTAARTTRHLLTDRIAELERELATAKAKLDDVANMADQEPIDAGPLEDQLDAIEATNAAVRLNNDAKQRAARKSDLRKQYESLGNRIGALDKRKADALAAAAFPVDGLGFDDSGVTYNGIPFAQSSAAEQIRVSLAMAMALNPKLRVIRILDGSLLDADNMHLIAEMAAAQDYQIWVERVEDGSATAVVIEDGRVAS